MYRHPPPLRKKSGRERDLPNFFLRGGGGCTQDNPVVMGFQMQICSILCFSWSILVSLRSSVNELHIFFYRRIYSTNIDCFVKDSFDLCGLLSVIGKQSLKQYNYNVHQSELLPRFQADFTSLAGISVTGVQTPRLTKRPKPRGTRRNGCFFSQANGIVA